MASSQFARRRDGSVTFTVAPDEAPVLRGLLLQLADLVEPEDIPIDADPLAAMVGIGTATETPDDPVLARLFPDAYADDPDAAGEFRRYTEEGLRTRKYAGALLAITTLDDPGHKRPLTPDEVAAWLGALNDLRLALGTRLDVQEDWSEQVEALADDDPDRTTFLVYDWLSWLQDTLVRCLG